MIGEERRDTLMEGVSTRVLGHIMSWKVLEWEYATVSLCICIMELEFLGREGGFPANIGRSLIYTFLCVTYLLVEDVPWVEWDM